MNKHLFDEFRTFIYQKSGIALSDSKTALVQARLNKRLRSLSIDSYEKYLAFLKNDESGDELIQFLDAISTNTTHFFREAAHFDIMKNYIAQLLKNGQRKVKIWSAASSSGEEPYTIAIVLLELIDELRMEMPEIKILATDISTKILRKAIHGVYPADGLSKMPYSLKYKYFTEHNIDGEHFFEVNDSLKKIVFYRRLNLSKTPYPMRGPMDIVFCRNVMIYFDNPVRKKLSDEVLRLLKPGGLFMIGHSESLSSFKTGFKLLKPAVYMKPESQF